MNTQVVVAKPDRTAIKEAKEYAKAAKAESFTKLMIELIKNPVFEIVMAFTVIEILQKKEVISDHGLLNAGNIAESGILACVYAQQMAALAPYIAQTVGGISSISKVSNLL